MSVSPRLATLHIGARGALATYDVSFDRWIIATSSERAVVTEAPAAAVASPYAFAHVVSPNATVVGHESLSDGFAVTLQSGRAQSTYVVKELGTRWIACRGSAVLCKSLRR